MQRVSKAWYWTFEDCDLWLYHLPPPLQRLYSLHGRPAKVEVAYQTLLRESWVGGEVTSQVFDIPNHPREGRTITGGLISPEGSWILSWGSHDGREEGYLDLWRGLGTDSLSVKNLSEKSSSLIKGAMVSPDGSFAFTFTQDCVVKWSGLLNDSIQSKSFLPKLKKVNGGTISGDGKWALTYGAGGQVALWSELESDCPVIDLQAGQDMSLDPHNSQDIFSGSLSSDGSWALTAGTSSIVFWKGFMEGNITVRVLRDLLFDQCVISHNGTWALTSNLGNLFLWTNIESNTPTSTLLTDNESKDDNIYSLVDSAISNVCIAPDDTWVVSVGGVMVVWDFKKPKPFRTLLPIPKLLLTHELSLATAFLSPDLTWAISFSGNEAEQWSPEIQLRVT